MSTLVELELAGRLTKIDGGLDVGRQPYRTLYGLDAFMTFLTDTAPTMSTRRSMTMSVMEQLDDLFHEFIGGGPLPFDRRFKPWRVSKDAVWYLKTSDVRIFGWFARKDIFIAARAVDKTDCEAHDLYSQYVAVTVGDRDQLELDMPKCIRSSNPDDVISFAN